MTDLDRDFHSYLVPQSGMGVHLDHFYLLIKGLLLILKVFYFFLTVYSYLTNKE
jgi:hypothetical protein